MADGNGNNGKPFPRSGQDAKGRFVKGNPGGPGNPRYKKVCEFRDAMSDAVDVDDMLKVMESLLEKAKQGDVTAAHELFDRLLGKPVALDVEERISSLEKMAQVICPEPSKDGGVPFRLHRGGPDFNSNVPPE